MKKTTWIARTAVCLALLLAVQFFTKSLGQLVTGSCVNLVLAVAALIGGVWSGVTVAVISPFCAYLLGIKKPTAHRALGVLNDRALIQKAPYGDISLTEEGARQARALERRRDDLILLFSETHGLSPAESMKAALALMSELEDESLNRLLQK